MSVTLRATAPGLAFVASPSGNTYLSDSASLVENVQIADVASLAGFGCILNTAGAFLLNLPLTGFRTAAGALLAAAAATVLGISSTPGTVLSMVSESALSNSKADIAITEAVLPPSYTPGSNINLAVDASITGAGTLSVKTITPTAWLINADGSQTALTVSAAQSIVAAGSVLNFTITGTANLVIGSRVLIKLLVNLTETAASGMVANIFSAVLS